MEVFTQIQEAALEVQVLLDLVKSDSCGAIDLFIGTVRNETQGKKVIRLDFEAYIPMAIKEME